MQKTVFCSILVLAVCFLAAPRVYAEGVREGKWSMTITTKVSGMEAQAAQAQQAMENMMPEEKAMMQQMTGGMSMDMTGGGIKTTMTRCLTNANPVPQMDGQDGCQVKHSFSGNTLHFEAVCKEATSTGDIAYEQDSMLGTIRSHVNAAGGKDATIDISGQYLGPCGA